MLAALDAPEEARVVALVGRLYPMKGQHELLETVPALSVSVPAVRVVLVGPEDKTVPSYAVKLKRRTAELGLEDRVSFVGGIDDAAQFMAGCDAIAIPSVPAERGNTESFSLVALEAMAVGTPIAGYAEGGLPEVLGRCALLVPTYDREGLVDALTRILVDTELAGRLAACGRERATGAFSLDHMIASLQACYREAMAA